MSESTISSTPTVNMYKGQKSILVMVIGKSGRGKSTALRNFDPASTFIISVIGKPLPFPKGAQYEEGKNMVTQASPDTIRRVMMEVGKKEEFSTLIIDDAQYIMATEFMDKAMVKGYDKFTIMARNIWEILILATKLRPGLKVYFLVHEDETNTGERKMKTLGRLLDDKITPEGLSTIVLYADVIGERDNRKYIFTTQSDGFTNAKSPFGMFPSQIPNDLKKVSDRIDEYYSGIELGKSNIKFDI